jgi:hypothetical protein
MKLTSICRLLLPALLVCAGCDSNTPLVDAGTGTGQDAGRADAGRTDAGRADAGRADAGRADAGGRDAGATDAGPPDGGSADAGPPDAGRLDAGLSDAGRPDAGRPDAGGPPTFDVRVQADGFCDMLRFDPPSIAVPAGTEFTVNWINATGCTDIDIDKNGTVPIVLRLPPGDSYHDTVRRWCGSFTGTFYFRAYYSPSYVFTLPVDCGA